MFMYRLQSLILQLQLNKKGEIENEHKKRRGNLS